MCYAFRDEPLAVPMATKQDANGLWHIDYTMLLAKAVTREKGEEHHTRIAYPIRKWVHDENARRGSHDNCIHLAPPQPASRGELDSYGSHRLLMLPSAALWSRDDREWGTPGRCWHDEAVYPLLCMDCEGITLEILDQKEFWQDMAKGQPDGIDALLGTARLEGPLYTARAELRRDPMAAVAVPARG